MLDQQWINRPVRHAAFDKKTRDEYRKGFLLVRRLSAKRNQWYKLNEKSLRKRIEQTVSAGIDKVDWDAFPAQNFTPSQIDREAVIAAADTNLDDVWEFLGSGPVKCTQPPWSKDIVSGYEWKEGSYYKDYKLWLGNGSDIKLPWEISRMHPLLHLGEAYRLTGDEKYAQRFVLLVNDWIDRNPFRRSVNWRCSMDVAIRTVNIIWARRAFEDSPTFTEDFRRKVAVSLYEHGFHIRHELEKAWRYNHNHYLSDLCGLIHLGLLFREVGDGADWLDFAEREFFHQMRTQMLPTGPTYERTVSYHRLVTEICLVSVLLLHRNGREIPLDISHRLRQMLRFVAVYAKPDGNAPVIGDQDDGRLLPYDITGNRDHRHILAAGALLFNDSTLKAAAGKLPASSEHLFGEDAKSVWDAIDDTKHESCSADFPDAGFYIMRSGDNYVFINNSGQAGYTDVVQAGHTHSDCLSFSLMVGGKDIFVDTGSYIYTSDPEARRLHRSTRMHNTATVDGLDQNEQHPSNVFLMKRKTTPITTRWESTPERDVFVGEHDGYMRLPDPVTHRREIVCDKALFHMAVTDTFTGDQRHTANIMFHTPPEATIEPRDAGFVIHNGDVSVAIAFSTEAKLTTQLVDTWISRAYGERDASQAIEAVVEYKGGAAIQTMIKQVTETD